MEQTKDYTPSNVSSCFVAAAVAVSVLVLVVWLASCSKHDGLLDITGTWERTSSAIEYRFFDDSRFQQSDVPGGQWIWKQEAGRIRLLGNPQRTWSVFFFSGNRMRVVESDTFEIERK